MKNFLSKLWNKVRPRTQREIEDHYLSLATDLADLERRQKNLQRDLLTAGKYFQ